MCAQIPDSPGCRSALGTCESRPLQQEKARPLRQVIIRLIKAFLIVVFMLTGCVDRIVESTDVFGDVH